MDFVDPDTGAYTQRCENTWRVFKRSMPHTGTSTISSKATYRDSRGVNTMEIILLETFSTISPTYMKCAKMRKLFLIPLYALFAFRSPLHGGKKTKCTASSRGSKFEERNQREKKRRDTRSKPEFFFNFVLIFRNKYNSRLPKQRLRGVAVQQGIIYHSEKSSLHRRT